DGSLELRLPVWTPGSYLIREYERHLQDLVVESGEGQALAVRKVAKARWRVEPAGAAVVVARYRVYGHEVTVRTSHLDDRPAIWGRAGTSLVDRKRLTDDVTAIIEAQAELFGDLPYQHYTFLLHLVPGGYGGLEHKNSSTLLATPFAFTQEKRYHDFLELVSH